MSDSGYVAVTYDGTNAGEVTDWTRSVLVDGWALDGWTATPEMLVLSLAMPDGTLVVMQVREGSWLLVEGRNLFLVSADEMGRRWRASA